MPRFTVCAGLNVPSHKSYMHSTKPAKCKASECRLLVSITALSDIYITAIIVGFPSETATILLQVLRSLFLSGDIGQAKYTIS